MAGEVQSRKFVLTINNPESAGLDLETLDKMASTLNPQYFCRCLEVGESGTVHAHLGLFRPSPIRFSTLKRMFPTAHIEKGYGTVKEIREYTLKGGKWTNTNKVDTSVPGTFAEYGTIPTEQEETAPANAALIAAIKEGKTTAEIVEAHPELVFRVQQIDILRETIFSELYSKKSRLDVEVTYLYGATGTGKTRSIFEKHNPRDICRITNYPSSGIRFDGYHGQDVLVFEEFHSQIPLSEMLNYLDVYPINLPARYSDRTACYTHVYITSNYPLEAQYRSAQYTEAWNAFLRRIHYVYEFKADGTIISVEKGGLPF